MKIYGNKQIKWASTILIAYAAIFLVLLFISLIGGNSDTMPATFFIAGFAVILVSIASGYLALKFKEDVTKGLLLNILGAVCGILFILLIFSADGDELAGYIGAIGVFVSALFMGGVNRNIRYLKREQ